MPVLTADNTARRKLRWRPLRRNSKAPEKLPVVWPAPDCHPPIAGIPISVSVVDWGGALSCRVVRADRAVRDIVVAVPEEIDWSPTAVRDHRALVGWLDHERWHEATAYFTSPMRRGDRFFRLRIKSVPIHRERRAHVRAMITRPISVYPRGCKVDARTADISEAAVRVVMAQNEPVKTGEKVQVVMTLSDRGDAELTSLHLAGYVYRTRVLCGEQTGRKETVIVFQGMPAAQRDYLRGLVYRWDLEHRNPGAADR